MKKGIRRVTRSGLPQTNSSSDHCIVISSDKPYIEDQAAYNISPASDGKIHVGVGHNDFGWEWERYNDCATKLEYVCALLGGCYNYDWEFDPAYEREIGRVKHVVEEFCGSPLVVDWDETYKTKKNDQKDEEDSFWVERSSVDHQSTDKINEIMETDDTLRDFLFNPKSWLFLGNDNDDAPYDEFYSPDNLEMKKSNPEAHGWMEFGGDLGRLDFDISRFPSSNDFYEDFFEINDVLSTIVYDVTKGKMVKDMSKKEMWTKPTLNPDYLYYGYCRPNILILGGKYYLRWASEECSTRFHNFQYSEEGKKHKKEDGWRPDDFESWFLSTFEEGKDFKLVQIHISSNELGDVV